MLKILPVCFLFGEMGIGISVSTNTVFAEMYDNRALREADYTGTIPYVPYLLEAPVDASNKIDPFL
jgi:hypothetical protein